MAMIGYSSVAIIPVKSVSKRVTGKNFKNLGDKPLFEHILTTALNSKVDTVFIDTDSEMAKERARQLGAQVIERPEYLTRDTASGNDLLLYEAGLISAEIYVQLFATAPFLRAETVDKALDILQSPEYDSVFTVTHIHSRFWFKGKPVNYDPKVLPRSQDAQPIIKETTGLYAIRRETLLESRCRIGKHPYMLEVDEIEGLDVDTEFDFQIAQFVWENMIDKHKNST